MVSQSALSEGEKKCKDKNSSFKAFSFQRRISGKKLQSNWDFHNANDVFVCIEAASWFHLKTSSIKPTGKINV